MLSVPLKPCRLSRPWSSVLHRGMPVICSAQTWPIIREYERTVTTVISGYVQPCVSHYLDRFENVLRGQGIACPLLITKTNGGVMGID